VQICVSERIDTVVIGGGQAGLATSACLTKRGVEHVVLERGQVGETWRSERWDGFYLNTPNWTMDLPGGAYDGDDPHAFSPLAGIVAYLEGYARSTGAPVRENVDATRLRQAGDGWTVETTDGELTARAVVVATGSFRHPTPSPVAAVLPDDVEQLHTSAYKRPEQLADGAVLVVGSGQSGCQISEELLQAGRRVYLSVGRCPWFPRALRGKDVVRWALDVGLMDDRVESLDSPAMRLLCNPTVSGNDGGHDCNPRTLAAAGATLLGRLEGCEHGTVRVGPGLGETLAAGDGFVGMLRKRVDEHVRAEGLDVPEDPPPEPAAPIPEPPAELDLRSEGIGTVLWANGFRPDLSWIDVPVADQQGWPRQQDGFTEYPGLAFVGVQWQRKRKSALLFGVGEDAEHVAATIAGSAP
jgi:putative flavoprotein involved in K+ transport